MPFTVTKSPQGTFSWADCTSSDVNATIKFMTELMGWTYETMPVGDSGMDYTMFYLDGKDVAAASGMMKGMEGMPSMWNNYVTVNDVDEMTKKAEGLGATVVLPAMDVLDSGRMSAIADLEGAVFYLWQPKKHIGARIINTPTAMCWNELYTKDLEKGVTNLWCG